MYCSSVGMFNNNKSKEISQLKKNNFHRHLKNGTSWKQYYPEGNRTCTVEIFLLKKTL